MIKNSPLHELYIKSIGFQSAYQSFAIFAALELKLLTMLDEQQEMTLDELVHITNTDSKGLELLINCLISIGIVKKYKNTYQLEKKFNAMFQENSASLKMLADSQTQCELWLEVAQGVSSNRIKSDISKRFDQPSEWTSQYQDKVQLKNIESAQLLARCVRTQIKEAKTMLDIGGGHGGYARAALEVNPELNVLIYDLASAVEYGQSNLYNEPLCENIKYKVGDARELEYDNAFDIALLSDLLHYFTYSEKRDILKRSIKSLANNGLLIISKFRLDSDGTTPGFSSFFSLQKYLETPNSGFLETDAQCAELLDELGLKEVETYSLSEQKSLVIGRRKI